MSASCALLGFVLGWAARLRFDPRAPIAPPPVRHRDRPVTAELFPPGGQLTADGNREDRSTVSGQHGQHDQRGQTDRRRSQLVRHLEEEILRQQDLVAGLEREIDDLEGLIADKEVLIDDLERHISASQGEICNKVRTGDSCYS
eukprot:763875-Pyramimonas_sp.AAC.1